MKKTPLGRILRGEIVALDGLGCGWLRIFLKEICKEHALMLQASNCVCQLLFADLKSRATPSATSSMLNAEFHSQYRLAKVSLSLCNSIFEIHISFQSSG